MDIEIKSVNKRFGASRRLTRCRSAHRNRRTGRAAGAVRLRQDHSCCALSPGLETPDSGSIYFSGEDSTGVHVRERQVGFVFQHYALFRHMTVFENVAFGLRIKPRGQRPSTKRPDQAQKCTRCWASSQLDWLADRYPGAVVRRAAPAHRAGPRAGGRAARRCCWTSPSARWTPRCARNCAAGCAACTTNCTSPASSSRTTRKRRWKSLTASCVMNAGHIEQVGTPREVWDRIRPRLSSTASWATSTRSKAPPRAACWQRQRHCAAGARAFDGLDEQRAVAYVRPHEIDIVRLSRRRARAFAVQAEPCLPGRPQRLPGAAARRPAPCWRRRCPKTNTTSLDLREGAMLLARPRRARIFPRAPDPRPALPVGIHHDPYHVRFRILTPAIAARWSELPRPPGGHRRAVIRTRRWPLRWQPKTWC